MPPIALAGPNSQEWAIQTWELYNLLLKLNKSACGPAFILAFILNGIQEYFAD